MLTRGKDEASIICGGSLTLGSVLVEGKKEVDGGKRGGLGDRDDSHWGGKAGSSWGWLCLLAEEGRPSSLRRATGGLLGVGGRDNGSSQSRLWLQVKSIQQDFGLPMGKWIFAEARACCNLLTEFGGGRQDDLVPCWHDPYRNWFPAPATANLAPLYQGSLHTRSSSGLPFTTLNSTWLTCY